MEHTDYMRQYWKYNGSETKEGYRNLVAKLTSIGAFQCKSQVGGENVAKGTPSSEEEEANSTSEDTLGYPVAWSQLGIFNCFKNTFTLPEHRRKGLANAVTLALARKCMEDTGVASSTVVVDNELSKAIHEKLGFIRQHKVRFHYYTSSHPDSAPFIANL